MKKKITKKVKHTTEKVVKKIFELRSKGLTHAAIAKKIGFSTKTVAYHLSK